MNDTLEVTREIILNKSYIPLLMTLFPKEETLQKEIESWNGFAYVLRKQDRELFQKMLDECHKYQEAINSKGRPFPSEALLMALIFLQHKMIELLIKNLNRQG